MATLAVQGVLLAAATPAILVVVLLLAGLVWWLSRRQARVFRIGVENGKVRDVDGSVPRRFVEDVEQLCQFWQIDEGWITGTRKGSRMVISVGGGIGQQHAQVFRNAWNYPVG